MNPMLTLIRAALAAVGRPGGRRVILAQLFPLLALEPVPIPVRVLRVYSRVVALALAFAAVLGAASPATAADWGRTVTTSLADGNLVEVRVLVDGSSTPLYQRAGAWDRHYFQAFRGRNYSVEVRNTTGQRIGVLMAVDGLNVVNGERSQLSNREAMYVLDPYETHRDPRLAHLAERRPSLRVRGRGALVRRAHRPGQRRHGVDPRAVVPRGPAGVPLERSEPGASRPG